MSNAGEVTAAPRRPQPEAAGPVPPGIFPTRSTKALGEAGEALTELLSGSLQACHPAAPWDSPCTGRQLACARHARPGRGCAVGHPLLAARGVLSSG